MMRLPVTMTAQAVAADASRWQAGQTVMEGRHWTTLLLWRLHAMSKERGPVSAPVRGA